MTYLISGATMATCAVFVAVVLYRSSFVFFLPFSRLGRPQAHPPKSWTDDFLGSFGGKQKVWIPFHPLGVERYYPFDATFGGFHVGGEDGTFLGQPTQEVPKGYYLVLSHLVLR